MPRISQVEFVSQENAEERSPQGREGIISITTPDLGPARLKPGWYPVLWIEFDDLEEYESGAVLFEKAHANRILGWLDRNEDRLDRIVVHCRMGVSRSAAVARFIADRYGIEEFDREYDLFNKRVLRMLECCARGS
jgi:predicted protein tyrosine phosphatase